MVHDPPNLIPGIGITLVPERPYILAKQSILSWNIHILKMVSAKDPRILGDDIEPDNYDWQSFKWVWPFQKMAPKSLLQPLCWMSKQRWTVVQSKGEKSEPKQLVSVVRSLHVCTQSLELKGIVHTWVPQDHWSTQPKCFFTVDTNFCTFAASTTSSWPSTAPSTSWSTARWGLSHKRV